MRKQITRGTERLTRKISERHMLWAYEGVLDMAVLLSTVRICSGQDLIYSPELMISEVWVHDWLTTLLVCLLVCLRLVARQTHYDGGGCVAAELFTTWQPGSRKCSSDPVLVGVFLFSILFHLVPSQ